MYRGSTVPIFGSEYKLHYCTRDQAPLGVQIEADRLLISMVRPHHPNHQKISKKIDAFIKKTASIFISTRTEQMAARMNVSYQSVRFKELRSRWGSCSSKRNLNFNWRLGHFEPPVIEYVIIHELAHLVHFDHSGSFWRLVGQHCPDYPKHQSWLKSQAPLVLKRLSSYN